MKRTFNPIDPLAKIFRKVMNRVGCLNALILFSLVFIWTFFQIYPLTSVDLKHDRLFYGKVHYARLHPGLDRLFMRINADNSQNFILWLDKKNKEIFEYHFDQTQPLAIWALPMSGGDYLVFALDADNWSLDAEALLTHQSEIRFWGSLVVLFAGLIFLWLVKEYLFFFRHMKWFENRLKYDEVG